MQTNWFILIPPLLVILIVLFQRRMLLALLVGIISSSLIAKDGNVFEALLLMIRRFWTTIGLSSVNSWSGFWESWNLLFFLFFICLGIFISLLQQPDVSNAFVIFIRKKIVGQRTAQIAALLLSACFFIDDYFSALTVGSVMRPCTQLYNIPSVKLAFLTTAMASSYAVLSPISSWVGEIVVQLRQVGVGLHNPHSLIAIDPFYLFMQTIPFIFYPILLIIGTWYIVLRGISYGPMAWYEKQNQVPVSVTTVLRSSASVVDFIVPLALLVSSLFVGILITGHYQGLGGTNSFLEALQSTVMPQALFGGSLCAIFGTIVWFLGRRIIKVSDIGGYILAGTKLMLPSILMLIHVWTLSAILKTDLQIGDYLVYMLTSVFNYIWLPLICFGCAGLVATLIGSAWATIGLLFPIVVPMAISLIGDGGILLVLPVIGATLSGSVLGTHISLIADNPIMSSASTGAPHLEHIKTMFWYIVPVIGATCCAYSVVGLGFFLHWNLHKTLFVALFCGLIGTIMLLELGQRLFGKGHKEG